MDPGTTFGNALREAFGAQAAFFALLAIGLNVQYGYTGLLNFGQIGFALVGAYGVGVAVVILGWSLWAGVFLGLLAGVGLALLLGLPTLRLRGDYFAIVTIAVAEVLRLIVRSNSLTDLTGGPFGLQNVAGEFADLNPFTNSFTIFGTWTYLPSQLWSGLVSWATVLACTGLVFLLMRSPWGRILKGIREDEDAVRSLGKNAFSYKMQSLILGGVIGSLAGVMLVLQTSTVNDISFLPRQTFFAYAILIIGGAATTWGPVVGTMIFWFMFTFLSSLLRDLDMNGLLPGFLAGADKIGAVAFATVGLTLMLLIIFRPQGILGDRQELLLDA
jgi:branched-chain amino acid transport system permease protein